MNDYTLDVLICPRCGDPLSSDKRCDCAGDPDRDYVTALRGMKTNRVLTNHGMRKVVFRQKINNMGE